MLKPKPRVTLETTVARIARRSAGVAWSAAGGGLTLALTEAGYELVAAIHAGPDALPDRYVMERPVGHILTQQERAHAIRALLGVAGERRAA